MIDGEKKIMLIVGFEMLARLALVAAGVALVGYLFWRFA